MTKNKNKKEPTRTRTKETKSITTKRTGAKIRGEREVSTATLFSRSSHLGKFSRDFELGFKISTEKRRDEV
jgi:hypothetical protein